MCVHCGTCTSTSIYCIGAMRFYLSSSVQDNYKPRDYEVPEVHN